MTTSRGRAGGGRDLRSLKAVLRVLKEKDIFASKSTVWGWRRRLPPSRRPPIFIEIVRMRPIVTASRRDVLRWIETMEPTGLFDLSRKRRATRLRRQEMAPAN